VIDGVDFFNYPWYSITRDNFYARVPIIVGSQHDEQLSSLPYNATQSDFNNFVSSNWGSDLVTPINQLYPATNYPPTSEVSSYWLASVQVNADFSFTAATRRTARWFSQWGSWLYMFDYPQTCSWGPPGEKYAYHAEDLPFVFLAENLLNGADEIAFSTSLAWYWTNFAVSVDPNIGGPASFNWPRYRNETDINIALNLNFSTQTGLRSACLDFWDQNLDRFSGCIKP